MNCVKITELNLVESYQNVPTEILQQSVLVSGNSTTSNEFIDLPIKTCHIVQCPLQ